MSRYHIIGIGGVGMSALAQVLLDQGHVVTGADRLLDAGGSTPVLEILKGAGVQMFPEDGSGVTKDTCAVIVSSAVEETNPGIAAARLLGIPVVHRASALAAALKGKRLLAVAGTCGKSSVTAILGHILAGAGFDPLVVNGAPVPSWDNGSSRVGSVRDGSGEWAVAEVDESDKSLTAFYPEAAVITNASADHFDMAETDALFDKFRKQVSGVIEDGRDGKMPEDVKCEGWSGSFTLDGVRYTIPMPGIHNVMNAYHAVKLALALGAKAEDSAAALATFPGIERRLQRVGVCGDAVVIDDYAHNPEKLRAMWETCAAAFPKGIAVVWRPHGFGPLRKMMDALAEMFAGVVRRQDALFVLPVYDAGGTADRSVNSDVLAGKLRASGVHVNFVQDLNEAETSLRAQAQAFGAIVTAGARDPGLPVLARRLAGK